MLFGRNGNLRSQSAILTPRQQITDELSPSEKLIWVDRPASVIHHAFTSIGSFLFGIPFFAFAVFWTWMASEPLRRGGIDGPPGFSYFFPMFGIPFLLVGLGMLLAPLWSAFAARHTIYALTDKRLIILTKYPVRNFQFWPLEKLDDITRSGSTNGPGNLYFAKKTQYNSKTRRTTSRAIGFIGINQPLKLEQAILEAQQSLKTSTQD
jgi:hypothetical protein